MNEETAERHPRRWIFHALRDHHCHRYDSVSGAFLRTVHDHHSDHPSRYRTCPRVLHHEDSIDIYNSIKQGHDFTEDFDENFYISQTSSELSLDSSKNRLYNYGADGEIVYSMTNPNVTYKVDKALKLKASYTVMIPVIFAGEHLFDLEIPITVTRSLTLKE